MDVDWFILAMSLAGGLALFLIGMTQVTESLKELGDDRLRWSLARLSSNRMVGATTGGAVTALIQSSSVTTVLTVGFVSAGLLSLTQAASVIIGANLGTTVTAQVIALKITDYALGLLAVGAIMSAAVSGRRLRSLGLAVAGLGMVFLGMEIMSDAMSPLKTYQPFLDLMSGATSPLIALAVGAAFTGLVQSSTATTGIVVVMAAEGLIDLKTGIALILGANIGTCVTALLASIGKGPQARRAAMIHVVVNLFGALVAVFFVDQIAGLVEMINEPTEFASPRQIANAHTLFNLTNTVVFLILLTPLVAFVRRIVPEKTRRAVGDFETAFLDPDMLDTPVLALEVVHSEIIRQGLLVRDLLDEAVPAAIGGTRDELDKLIEREHQIDSLHSQILDYLAQLGRGPLGDDQGNDLLAVLAATNELEQLSDTIEVQVIRKGYERLENAIEVSPETEQHLRNLHRASLNVLDMALEAISARSWRLSRDVINSKQEVKDLERDAAAHLAKRLVADEPGRVQAYSFEVEIVDALVLVNRASRRVARSLRLPDEVSG